MKCSKCQSENREGIKFCEECGAKLERQCPACKAKIPLGKKFCGHCGRKISDPSKSPALDYNQPQSYTPKFLAAKILTHRGMVEGERKLITVLFADVANYTAISERLDPEDAQQIEEVGLVLQSFDTQKVGTICSCCGDCCGMLRSLKMQPVPAAAVQSNYFADVDGEACSGCETCLERCQMEAIEVVDEIATINLDRCIGCGLCVSGCPTEAMQLVKKPETYLYEPPKTVAETYMRLARERGRNLMPQ